MLVDFKKMYWVRRFSLVVFLLTSTLLFAQKSSSRAYFDFSQRDFRSGGTAVLRGESEFYWGELLTPNDFRRGRHNKPVMSPIPGSWTQLEVEGQGIPARGCATYRFAIVVPKLEQNEEYVLYIPTSYSSYRLWVNGQQTGGRGHVANNPYDATPSPNYSLVSIADKVRMLDTIEVIVQMSNYSYPVSGLVRPMKFGTRERIANDRDWREILHFLSIGAFLLLAIANLMLFRIRRDEQAALWFALGALLAVLRIAFGESDVYLNWIPWLTWSIYHKIVYLSSLGGLMSLFLFIHCRYRRKLRDIYVHWAMGVGIALAIFIFFTPVALFTSLRFVLYLYGGALLSLVLFVVLLRSLKEFSAILLFGGSSLFFICIILDILQYYLGFESYFPYVTLGISTFVLLATYSVVRNFGLMVIASTKLRKETNSLRFNYEQKIKQLKLENEQQQRRFNLERQEQEEQVWVDSGIAALSTIMAQNQHNMKLLCEQTLQRLTKYMHVNAAILYVARLDYELHQLRLYVQASFGLTQEQLEKYSVLDEDQGLVGACYRDNTFQHISNLPEGFMKITSGLGECTPPSLLLMPLQSTAGVVGVLELGRFEDFKEHELNFVKRIAVILANNLIHTKNNEDYIHAMEKQSKDIEGLKGQLEAQEQYKEQLEAELEEYRREGM